VCSNAANLPETLANDVNIPCTRQPQTIIDWARGQRGWGSPAPAIIALPSNGGYSIFRYNCPLQGNPIEVVTGTSSSAQESYEIQAVGADLFHHWLYYYDREEFPNVDWGQQAYPPPSSGGCFSASIADPTNPGFARFAWMEYARDIDGNGLDPRDFNNDGVIDLGDTNNDGVINSRDLDADGDGRFTTADYLNSNNIGYRFVNHGALDELIKFFRTDISAS
jgi:hypothetical protein